MANPQPDKYVKISTELWEAFCKIRIPGEARQCLDVIIRKTYGYKKKEDWIALSQFSKDTGIVKTHVARALQKLKNMNVITVTQKGNAVAPTYCIQKNYEKWKSLPKKVTLPKKVMSVTQKGNLPLPKKVLTIDNTTIDNTTINREASPQKFKKPTTGEVEDYIEKMGYNFSALKFISYYESIGWKINKAKMVSWKSACTTWEQREKEDRYKRKKEKPDIYITGLKEPWENG